MKHSHIATALFLAYHITFASASDSCLLTPQQLCQNQTLFNSLVKNLSLGNGKSAVTVTPQVWQDICQQYNQTFDLTVQLGYNLLPLLVNPGNSSITQPIVNTVQQLLTTYPLNSLSKSASAQANLRNDTEGQLLLNTYNSQLVQLNNGLLPNGVSSLCPTSNDTALLQAIVAETNVWNSSLFNALHNLTIAASGALVVPAVSSVVNLDALKDGAQCVLPVQQWTQSNVEAAFNDFSGQAQSILDRFEQQAANVGTSLQSGEALLQQLELVGDSSVDEFAQDVAYLNSTFVSALARVGLQQDVLNQLTSSGVTILADQLMIEYHALTSNMLLSCLLRDSSDISMLGLSNAVSCAPDFTSNATSLAVSTFQALNDSFWNSSIATNPAPATLAMLRDQLHAYNGGYAAGGLPACNTGSALATCATGSQTCVVYNSSTQTAAYTCYDPSQSVCNLLTQSLCSVNTPAACGAACYNPYTHHCQVNTTDLRSSTVAGGQAAALTGVDSTLATVGSNSTSKSTSAAYALKGGVTVTLAGVAAIVFAALF